MLTGIAGRMAVQCALRVCVPQHDEFEVHRGTIGDAISCSGGLASCQLGRGSGRSMIVQCVLVFLVGANALGCGSDSAAPEYKPVRL